MIAKEPPAAEIQSGKNPVPVGHSDADRIEKVPLALRSTRGLSGSQTVGYPAPQGDR